MLKIKIETELKAIDISIPAFDPQSSPEIFLIEIRHALVGMGFPNKYIDDMLGMSNGLDLDIEENMDDNPPSKDKPKDKH